MTTQSITPSVSIADITIHQDADGRYSLNDLHRASGGEQRHRPKYWLENQQTVDLIAELTKGGNPPLEQIQPVATIKGGNAPGTFVVRELVYAYAMWISPSFHLKVIRTFDAVVTGPKLPIPNFNNPAEAARAWADEFERRQLIPP